MPASPELVEILRKHIDSFPTGPDGRLFVTRVGRAGVPPTQVTEWAGQSVNVLLRVYAKCVYGQDEVARIRIEAALALTTAAEEPPVAVTSSRIPPERR